MLGTMGPALGPFGLMGSFGVWRSPAEGAPVHVVGMAWEIAGDSTPPNHPPFVDFDSSIKQHGELSKAWL